jgi:hypothetical protein
MGSIKQRKTIKTQTHNSNLTVSINSEKLNDF